jgi:hypothetical protein
MGHAHFHAFVWGLLQFLVGFLLAFGTGWAVVWLTFIYPYSDVRLRWLWAGVGLGLGFFLSFMAYFLVLFYTMWKAD